MKSVMSFELHQSLMEYEAFQEDLREYAGKNDEVTTAKDVIFSGILASRQSPHRMEKDFLRWSISWVFALLKSVASLSTGEMRKTLIARALIKSQAIDSR
jgi:ABC-type molybdenum transport system ATPase subunit/photorepair protein PhrA